MYFKNLLAFNFLINSFSKYLLKLEKKKKKKNQDSYANCVHNCEDHFSFDFISVVI